MNQLPQRKHGVMWREVASYNPRSAYDDDDDDNDVDDEEEDQP